MALRIIGSSTDTIVTQFYHYIFLCFTFFRNFVIYIINKRNGLHRTVYPAELQLDVGLQNDEAECRNEMHGNRIIYSNDIVPAKATGIQTRF